MKRIFLITLLFFAFTVKAQQFSLYGTKTLYDAFENPARKVYTQDTSRQFSFNFFLPTFGLNVATSGDAQPSLKKALATSVYSARGLPFEKGHLNKAFLNINAYIAMLRIYTSVLRHGELGLAWQVKSDTYAHVTNETLAILDSYKLFDTLKTYHDIFNDHAVSQSYQQFSISYRENLDRYLGVGVKLSYLSGLAYNSLDIDSSSLGLDLANLTYGLKLAGRLRSSFAFHDDTSNVEPRNIFKNPGIAVTAGFTLKKKYGWTVYGQLKDIGFIRWHRQSPVYKFNSSVTLSNGTTSSTPSQFGHDLDDAITAAYKPQSFVAPVNGKAEVFVTKEYEYYRGTLMASKSVFYPGGDYGLLNNFKYKALNLGVSAVYNTINAMQVGIMGMIKTNGFELFMGSDQAFKSRTVAKGIAADSATYGSGHTGASFYFGIGFNFGRVMEHPWYSNKVGIDD